MQTVRKNGERVFECATCHHRKVKKLISINFEIENSSWKFIIDTDNSRLKFVYSHLDAQVFLQKSFLTFSFVMIQIQNEYHFAQK